MRTSLAFIYKFINEKKWLLLGYFALVLECITPIMAVILQRDLIDKVFISGNYNEFPMLMGLYALFFFGPKLWFTVRKVTFFHISYQAQMMITREFLSKVYKLSTGTFNNEQIGKLLNNIRNDITDACDIAVNQLMCEMVKIALSIVLLSLSIAYINIFMLIVTAVIALIYYFLLGKFSEKTKAYSQESRSEKANISVTIEEGVSSIRETLAFGCQDEQLNNYDKKFDSYYKALLKEGLYKIKILLISEPFLYGTKLIVILFGGIIVISKGASMGEFVVSFTLVDQLVSALGELFQQGLTGKRFMASVNCILPIMNQENEEFGSLRLSENINSIRFDNVTFSYQEDLEPVLKNLTIDFPVGKKIAIVGESGSGKSTIAQLLLRMHQHDKGKITINGTPIKEYGDSYVDRVSAVFQDPHFIPMSIKNNLIFDKKFTQDRIESTCKEMLCHNFIEEFDKKYDTEVGERGTNLSGGQRQRLALSRALLKNTDILILDEATSALDTETEYIVQQNIDKLRDGKTTFIIAHRLSTIKNADIIYVLDKGTLAAWGSHDKLIESSSIYRKLYDKTTKLDICINNNKKMGNYILINKL